jgi:antitoxin VapB
MSLNIKNERVHELAREAARRTGKTQTSVIEEALARLLADLDPEPQLQNRLHRVQRALDDVDRRLTDDDRASMSTDQLYDDRGLPA